VDGEFVLSVGLAGQRTVELAVDGDFEPPGDPRPLGVRIREARCDTWAGPQALDLEVDYRAWMKRHLPARWIEELIATARARPREYDDLFQRTRGPVSAALESWLAENAAHYDVVMGTSVPFGTLVAAARHAQSARVPLVQIPEFHIDDEYYHWQSYYDALTAADWLITHPRAATPLFFERIGARSEYVPNGIDPDEAPTPEDEAVFRRLYPDATPFVLIVGRKDRAKNYEAVIRAVARLNGDRPRCGLVMIGRDEDGVALDRRQVTYLGGQPRGVVLAALRRALCLVSMSESESFGIVILESWVQGRPVVISAACQASVELVVDGQDGLHATSATLAERIGWLLDHREAAAEMGRRGREKACASYTWNEIATRVNARLLELAERRAHV
jgi:glycosyltransferase involved in cell wall biosynthesis